MGSSVGSHAGDASTTDLRRPVEGIELLLRPLRIDRIGRHLDDALILRASLALSRRVTLLIELAKEEDRLRVRRRELNRLLELDLRVEAISSLHERPPEGDP